MFNDKCFNFFIYPHHDHESHEYQYDSKHFSKYSPFICINLEFLYESSTKYANQKKYE